MTIKILSLFLSACLPLFVFGFVQQDIFPDKKGQELLNMVVNQYKPNTVLTYNEARDQLWRATAAHNHDSLRCVYTGFAIYLTPATSDPSEEAYQKGINCEHTWPQSLGAEGNAKSDMHHLYPTRIDVNSARGNLPFSDIPDHQTQYWYRLNYKLSNIPSSSIDEYSEINNSWFEPREDHKGNVARAMIYFYTMYKSQANTDFFNKQLSTFYKWHYQDPVDDEELWRCNFIASKQENKPNPFILDSTLLRRAYFPQYKGYSSVGIAEKNHVIILTEGKKISVRLAKSTEFNKIEIFGLKGELIYREELFEITQEKHIELPEIANGIYILKLSGMNQPYFYKIMLFN